MNKSDFIIISEGKYSGLETKSGEKVLPVKYDKILDYDDDGYVRFIKDGYYGTIDFEGNVCIPLSEKLTHLGVFYKGSARAEIDNVWGLVDVYGKHVTDFIYKSINAHRKNGYWAVTLDGKQGLLSENGNFKSTGKSSKPKPLYSYIATYRNHVAPAVAQNGKWVFIDENQNRINDIEYWSMDHVLRQGVYSVAKGPDAYGIANFEGVPLIDEWYDHPCRFEKGFAICDIKRQDENGNEIKTHGGQPAYFYGILDLNGKYLFPPVYSSLSWNDHKTKNCWLAQDENWAYLLFPDGSHKTYAKSEIKYDGYHECIPKTSFSHDIKDKNLIVNNIPELVATQYYSLFDENSFLAVLSSWLGTWTHSLEFFYRDTDAEIDVKKIYKRGHFVRTDCPLEVTKKLLRPVHKIRFLIAARRFLTKDTYSREREIAGQTQFMENMIPENSNFLVVDVQKCGGVTQVVLLHFPHGAMLLANQFKIKFSKFKPIDSAGVNLNKAAEYDLQIKFGECVHGHSLDSKWCDAMFQPVGCNQNLEPNKLIMESDLDNSYFAHSGLTPLDLLEDRDYEWKKERFIKIQPNSIKIFVGDITGRVADVLINPVAGNECELSSFQKNFEECADLELKKCCEKGLDKVFGALLVTDAYNFPYKKIIHIRLSGAKTLSDVPDVLETCLDNALKEAEKAGAKSILLPAMAFAGETEMKIVVKVLSQHLFAELYHGNIEIFAQSRNDAEKYKSFFETREDFDSYVETQ